MSSKILRKLWRETRSRCYLLLLTRSHAGTLERAAMIVLTKKPLHDNRTMHRTKSIIRSICSWYTRVLGYFFWMKNECCKHIPGTRYQVHTRTRYLFHSNLFAPKTRTRVFNFMITWVKKDCSQDKSSAHTHNPYISTLFVPKMWWWVGASTYDPL